MKKEIRRLPDEHLDRARAMVLAHKKKKNCKKCYDRGYAGVTEENMLVPCSRCVDEKALMAEWRAYVKTHPALVELYGDSLDEETEASETP